MRNLIDKPTRSGHAKNGNKRDRSVRCYNGTPEKAAQKQSARESQQEHKHQLLVPAILIVFVGLVGTLVWDLALQDVNVPGTEHNAVLGITIFIQAMIAFFGILNLDEAHATKVSPLTKGGMRGAITGAVVVTYISLVVFHTMVEFAARQSLIEELTTNSTTDLNKDPFVNSFTEIVKITIIFYFASEAALHWINKSKLRE